RPKWVPTDTGTRRSRGTGQDAHAVAPDRFDSKEHEDTAVRSTGAHTECHDERAGSGATRHHRWNDAEWVGSSEWNRALGDKGQTHQPGRLAAVLLRRGKEVLAHHGCNRQSNWWNHTGGHDRCHDFQGCLITGGKPCGTEEVGSLINWATQVRTHH